MNAKTPQAPALVLPAHRGVYRGGRWHDPIAGRVAPTLNPSTGACPRRRCRCVGAGRGRRGRGRAARLRRVEGGRAARARADPARRPRRSCAGTRDELALIDAANCGNPVHEMVRRRAGRRRAARLLRGPGDRDEGRVDPDGARRRQLLGARAARRRRAHLSVQPSVHVRRRQVRRAARRRQRGDREAARPGAAVVAAARRARRRPVPGRRVQRAAGRPRHRRRAGGAPRRRDGRASSAACPPAAR